MVGRVYFLLERAILAVTNSCAAVIQGVSLGLLSTDQLEALTVQRYLTDVSHQSYADISYLNSGFSIWERETILRYFPQGSRILVAAAGAGREMIALAKAGYSVDGFDCCSRLVESGTKELARQKMQSSLNYAPPSRVFKSEVRYDAAMIGFSGYMYIPSRDRRIRFLREMCEVLNPGAPILLSFTEGSPGRRRRWTARIGTTLRRLRNADPVEEGDCLKDGFQHRFVFEQVSSELDDAGLDLVHYSGGSCYGHAVGVMRRS